MTKIVLNTKDVLPILSVVASVVNNKNTFPILDCVRIETQKERMALTTSDNESWLTMYAPIVEGEQGFIAHINAKNLLQALRNLGDKQVSLMFDDAMMAVTCKYDNGEFNIPYIEDRDFPLPVEVNLESIIINKEIQASKLKNAISSVECATASDEIRPILNGVHFDFFTDGMVSVATDSRKMVKFKDLSVTSFTNGTVDNFTLSNKVGRIILSLIANLEDEGIKVISNEQNVWFKCDYFSLTSRLIEGRYPNYDSVIPRDNDKIAIIDKSQFIAALKRVLLMGNPTSELVILSFTNNRLDVSAEDIDFQKSASEFIDCTYSNEDFKIGFKGSVLLQLLTNITGVYVKISMKDPSRAALVQENVQAEGIEYTSLIMPMRYD